MNGRGWARGMVIAGLVLLLVGLADPLEGSLLIVPAAALLAVSARLTHSRYRRLLYVALGLVAAGVAALWIMSALGGVGGTTGHSMWWLLVLLPYPVGWLLALLGGLRKLREGFDGGATPPAAPPAGAADGAPGRNPTPVR